MSPKLMNGMENIQVPKTLINGGMTRRSVGIQLNGGGGSHRVTETSKKWLL